MRVGGRAGSKLDSVWHNFRGAALARMRAVGRARHPTRELVDALMRRWFDRKPFDWLDVGVVGMVDYERLRPRMNFRFTGADLSESVAEDARRYLRRPDDRIVIWDVQEPPDPSFHGRFDLVTLRHILNHCEYYERPLEHVARVLHPGGRVVIVLHLALIEGPDEFRRHREWEVPGEVIGNRYNRAKFLKYFGRGFIPDLWVRVDDGKKPNDVIVGRRRGGPDAGHELTALRLWMPPGRWNTPLWVLAWLRFALVLRRLP